MNEALTHRIQALVAAAAGDPQLCITDEDVQALRRRMETVAEGMPRRILLSREEREELDVWRTLPGVTAEWSDRDVLVLKTAAVNVATERLLTPDQRARLLQDATGYGAGHRGPRTDPADESAA